MEKEAIMRDGIRIGRVFGINIYLDWSWIFIFLLVTWSLAIGVFPVWHPDWSTGLSLVVATVASLLFFASVLLHELSHSLVARARGLPVRNITLFLFGGASNLEREPHDPKTEFLVAIVGPITSIALGFIFLFLAGSLASNINGIMDDPFETFSKLSPLATLLLWLGPINILVGLFNLLPGFPLDGGRILRSILWAVTKNFRKATQWAAGAGQLIAWLLIISGIAMALGATIPVFGTGLINGLWLIFIGWFLNVAARQSYRQVVVQDLLEDLPVALLMRNNVPAVSPDLSVGNLVYKYIIDTGESAFPVVEDDRIVGLVALEDVRKIPREAWERTNVREIMTQADQLAVVSPQEKVSEALNQLEQRDVRQVPVVQDGHLLGLLRRRDIMRWLQTQSEFATN
jgi:Zn-dependent protease/CBS domain-containing protein